MSITSNTIKPVVRVEMWGKSRKDEHPSVTMRLGHGSDAETLMYCECRNLREADRVMARIAEVFGDAVEVSRA